MCYGGTQSESFFRSRKKITSQLPPGVWWGEVLTGKYNDQDSEKRYESASEEAISNADKIVEISKEINRSPAQVTINWVRQQQEQAQIIPILSARSVQQLEDNLGVLDFHYHRTI